MPNYRRSQLTGGTFFFTVVSYRRREILTLPESRIALRSSVTEVRVQYPFQIDAWVLLPNHLHCIWSLPKGDNDFSKRWGLIKAGFSKKTKHLLQRDDWLNESRKQHREGTIWQRRFWEHQIRDERDYQIHCDYLHFNPVKHRLVANVTDWPYSTFHRYVRNGVYSHDWGGSEIDDGEFGEYEGVN